MLEICERIPSVAFAVRLASGFDGGVEREQVGLRRDGAFAEGLQRIRHRGDLVVLARSTNLRVEVAVGQQLHRTLQAADPPSRYCRRHRARRTAGQTQKGRREAGLFT
jgi:hypothetical protein